MELLYNGYSQMSINDYFRLRKILIDLEDADENELLFNIIAFLCGTTPDEVYNAKMSEVINIKNKIGWIFTPIKRGALPINIKMCGKRYYVHLDMRKCTTQQYIDFTQYAKDREKFYTECLSCIIIPEGYKYNEGYDALDVAKLIGDNVSIEQAESIYYSFALASKILFIHSLKSLMRKTMKSLRKTKKEGMTLKRIKEMRIVINTKRQIQCLSGMDI